MEFFMAAQKRKTVRNFEYESLNPLLKTELNTVSEKLSILPNLKPIAWQLEQDPKALGKFFSKVHEDNVLALVEYGFEGEQMVLRLVEKGYGTMWQAINTEKGVPALIRFGKSKGENLKTKLLKTFIKGGERKPITAFIDTNADKLTADQKKIIDSLILSPSAINRQPWKFTYQSEKSLRIEVTDTQQYNFLDMGIVLAHGFLAFQQLYGRCNIQKRETMLWELSA